MHFTSALVLYGMWMLHAATTASASCNANNCLRAVRASAFTTRHGTADCSSYFMVTVTQVTTTSTVTKAHKTTTTVKVVQRTVSPTAIPAYASACKGCADYSSACLCVGVTHSTTTVAASTTITPTSTATINTSAGYVIVSPSSCPPSTPPTGTPIGQSNSSFSDSHDGLQYQQFPGSQFILQNATSGPFYVDLSNPSELVISNTGGDTLIIYSNGSFAAFAGHCELEIVGSWQAPPGSVNKARRDFELVTRQASSALCNDVQFFCNNGLGAVIAAVALNRLCGIVGAEIGADIGGGIGFLGNIFGPGVGIPTTISGIILGQKFGGDLCTGVVAYLVLKLCQACPSTTQCGPGTITCNSGPCRDALSDPNNCGKCGNVCASGLCQNGACSNPTCNGAACGGIQSCTGNCFCFEGASTAGFCGQNTPCASDPPCSSDADCALGSVCAVNTCCGSSICLAVCGGQIGKRGMGFVERTLGGTNASYPAGVPPPGF